MVWFVEQTQKTSRKDRDPLLAIGCLRLTQAGLGTQRPLWFLFPFWPITEFSLEICYVMKTFDQWRFRSDRRQFANILMAC